MMKHLIYSLLILCTATLANAQVTVQESPEVASLMQKYQANERSQEYVEGYRIQIITTPDRRKMETVKAKFTNLYPDVYLEWEHVSPYYQVRVGAFENKMQLMPFMIELKSEFAGAIPVVSDIKKVELIP